MIVSHTAVRRSRAARAVVGAVLAGLLATGAALALAPDADAASSARANSVKITPTANSVKIARAANSV